MKIAIDAMSGDLGSAPVVQACATFAKNHPDVTLCVCGKEEELQTLAEFDNIEITDARDVVTMNDSVLGVRRKKESSMVKALMMARNDEADAVVSCGNTGAFYTAAMLFVKRIEGVEKSCLMATLPTYNGKGTCMLDVGANAENTAKHLEDFALMGSIYAREARDIENPTVALLNIGEEEHKGNEMHQEVYQLLSRNKNINFAGNMEGRDILSGKYDIIVTDGFTGNVALKATEGAALIIMKAMKEAMLGSTKGKIGALLAKKDLYSLKDKFDYKSVGGAMLMGFSKTIVKAHGGSDAVAFGSAMELAYKLVSHDVTTKMKEGLQG